ncbi:MFS transporter [Homoserinibacter sp. GY 40078]|uniref:MFS transporter n=1 Tax=Homoserinibacter sp. GY 40078 TaxID=2603275 RepID=UPI0011C7FC0B|nr:MFS transporter [Homoserinibacter sp. GY 40078]TXK19706.1 MFS transporter [Homoserinibacter sp. GY 40078]
MTEAEATMRPSRLARARAALSDPVLRSLTISTLVGTIGRGITVTLVVLYLSFVGGFPAEQVAVVFTVGAAVGIGASYFGGHLADIVSARWLAVASVFVAGLALASYALVTELWAAILIESIIAIALGANTSIRSAIIARAFTGQSRVTSRAVLRTVTNVGIALGSGVGAIALAIGTPEAYRAILVVGGLAYAGSAVLLVGLPARVDAPARLPDEPRVVRGRSPWRDPRYLAFSALAAVFAIQFGVMNVGLPLWIAHHTVAPEFVFSIMLVANTVLVILLQVPLSRGTNDLRRAGGVTAVAGVLMAAACLFYGSAAIPVLVAAVVLLLVGTVLHALAEVLSQAGAWGLSFELADPDRPGAYQGVYSMAFAVGSMVAPLVIAATALEHQFLGWIALAAMFLLAAAGVTAIAFRAARTAPAVRAE